MALEESSRNPRVAWTSDITEAALAQRSAAGDGHERPERHQSCSGDVGGRRSSIGPGGSWPSALPRAHAFSWHIQVRRRKRVGGHKRHKAPAGESVAATATTSISSTTTADRTVKRRKMVKKSSKKQASAVAAPSTSAGWQQHQRQQHPPLRIVVPPVKPELVTPADLAPSPTAAVAPASPSLSKRQQPAASGRRHPSQQVARKEPRPRHHRKDEDAKKIPA
ncbi:unnamed protein product, partial [Ectocarpus sp. 12 AP-2014]